MVTGRRRGGRSPLDRLSGEGGSASLLVAVWAVALTLVAIGGIVLASALATRSRVNAAADLSALAAASAVLAGPTEACARARGIATDNGAAMVSCAVSGAAVRVEVVAPAPQPVGWLLPGRGGVLRARAHAELTAATR